MWTFLVAITLGWGSFYTQPIFFWPLLLLLLASCGVGVWLVIELRKEEAADTDTQSLTAMIETPGLLGHMTRGAKGIRRTTRYLGLVLLGAVLTGPLGWLWRDHQLTSPPRIYTDVLIRQRYDATHFELLPARMAPWQATSCTPLDWAAGEKMRFVAFQQRYGCKDFTIAGWYDFYNDDRTGKRLKFTAELINVGY